jgi:hypothetical protein
MVRNMARYTKFNINSLNSFDDFISDMAKAELKPITVAGKIEPEINHVAVVNTKTNEVAQIASPNYKILPHADFFSMTSDLIRQAGSDDVKGYILETNGGDSYTARLIFNDIEIEEPNKGANIKVGMEFSNSYDSVYSARGRAFYLRMSCTNQMIMQNIIPECMFSRSHNAINEMALLEAVTIRAERFMSNLVSSGAKFKNVMENAIETELYYEHPIQVQNLFEDIFGGERHAKKMIDGINHVATKEPNNKYSLTKWDLYNMVTDYASHKEVTPNVFESILQKAESKILLNKNLAMPVYVRS